METFSGRALPVMILAALIATAAIAQSPCAPSASNGGPYCPGSTISLFATSPDPTATFAWTGPNFTSTLQNPTIPNADAATNAGSYSVVVNGCSYPAANTTVVVNPYSTIHAPYWVTTTSTGNTATGPDGSANYAWSISGNGTITDGANAQTVTFTAGAVGTATLTLGTGCSSSSSVVEIDPQPTISANYVSVQPGPKGTLTPLVLTISLSGPSTQNVYVQYSTANQTAIAGKDYVATSGTAFFQPPNTTQNVTVYIYGTKTNTQTTFLLNLYNPVNATVQTFNGWPARGKGTILAK
jgi:large repetitive protein